MVTKTPERTRFQEAKDVLSRVKISGSGDKGAAPEYNYVQFLYDI